MNKKSILTGIMFLVCFTVYSQIPSIQAYNINITNRTSSSFTASWTRGNGSNCLVTVKPAVNATSDPSNGSIVYSANSVYGSGSNLGNSNYVVYKGTGTSVNITGLNPSTNYTVRVYEYNTISFPSLIHYYSTSITTNNPRNAYTLCTQPSVNASNIQTSAINYTTATITWTIGNGAYTLVSLDEDNNGFALPQDGVQYTASSIFGNGSSLGTTHRVVYNGSGSSVSVSNLLPARLYRIRAFEFCGSSTGTTYNYNTSGYPLLDFYTLNNQPTLNTISNQTICVNSSAQTISLSGISDGSSQESQNLTITATSSNQTLIPNSNISINYTNPNTSGTLTYTPAANQSGTATITVIVNDGWSQGNPTNSTITRTFTVTVNPKPGAAGVISGPAQVCKNGVNITYSVSPISNATGYVWSGWPANTNIVSGSNTNSITVNFPPSVTANTAVISVYGTNSFGCGNGTSNTKSISFDVLPTTANAGPDQIICTGTTQLQGNIPIVGSGVWTVVSGSASFNNTNQYNTNVTGIASGQTVTLQWSITNGVCPASTDQVLINYDPSAPQCLINADFYANNTNPCVGQGINFVDNSIGATGWSWNFGPGASPATSTLQNPTNISYSTAGTKTVTLTITGPNGSDVETKTAYINVQQIPGNATAISGLTTVCAGQTQVIYSVNPVAGATYYDWVLPAGATINSGSGTESISVNFAPSATSGTITVTPQNACGNGGMSTLSITVNPLPDDPTPISGLSTVCQGQTGVIYSVSPIANALSYTWQVPPGANIVANNNNTITIDFDNTASSGIISVFGVNACGNGNSEDLNITVNPLPGPAINLTGLMSVTNCPATNSVIYTVDPVSNATGYNWLLPSGATIISGNNTNSITVDYTFGASSGNIEVVGVNSCGTGSPAIINIMVDEPVSQDICLVTVNEESNANVVVWEKANSDLYKHYNIYREVTTNNYQLIATVPYDSLSEYVDSVANPNITSYKYKITAVDTCMNESPQSLYHNTIHLQYFGNGNLQWTLYGIESQPNPVDFYQVYRDDSTTGNWNIISSTIPGNNFTFTDVNYAQFPNCSYRVDVIWLIECTSTRAGINTSRSNAKSSLSVDPGSVNDKYLDVYVKLYPNPTNGVLTLSLENGLYAEGVIIYDAAGRLINNYQIAGANTYNFDISNYENGMYLIKVVTNTGTIIRRLVKN